MTSSRSSSYRKRARSIGGDDEESKSNEEKSLDDIAEDETDANANKKPKRHHPEPKP